MADVGSLLEIFMRAQVAEEGADATVAAQHYRECIAAAEKTRLIKVTDEALQSAAAPPLGLVAAMALTSLGGLHLDLRGADVGGGR